MNLPNTSRLFAALLASFLCGCMPYDELKTKDMQPGVLLGYFIGNGLFWLGVCIVLAALLYVALHPRK